MNEGNMKFDLDPDTGDLVYETQTPPVKQNPASGEVELVGALEENTLAQLATKVIDEFEKDEVATAALAELRSEYITLLGAGRESDQEDDEAAADTSDHPLLMTALLRFQAKALSALLPSDDSAVRTKPSRPYDVIEDPEERKQAEETVGLIEKRVQDFYTEYLFERLDDYEDDTDKLLFDMGLLGAGVRKVRKDETLEETPVIAEYVPLEDLHISYDGKRLTQKIQMSTQDLVRRMRLGYYRPVALSPGLQGASVSPVTDARDAVLGLELPDDTDPHMIYEVYTELFLREDPHSKGLARPYVVTIHAATHEILSVQRNWDRNDKSEKARKHFVFYTYHPGKNAVAAMGLGAILGGTTRSLRTAQRRSLEAAYLQNHPSGFKLSSLTIRDQSSKIKRAEFIDVDSPTDDIRKAIQALPFQGPSAALQSLSQTMEQNGKELGGIASIDFAALMKSGVAAGPAMAAFEESSEFQTSVHRRLYKANRTELKLIHDRMREVRGNQQTIFGDGQQALQPGDLMAVDIIPYMKPGQVSRQKMIMDAQATLELSERMPDVVDKRRAVEEYLRAIGRSNVEDILVSDPANEEAQPQPTDPITEYAMIVQGQPVRAAPQQNHEAHLDIHASQLRMLATSQLPVEQGEAAMAALSAHIAEHVGLDLVSRISAATGVPMEEFGGEMSPEMEMQIAPAVVQAMLQIEAETAPDDGAQEESKIALEQVKAQSAERRETIKLQASAAETERKLRHEREMADLKHRQAMEVQNAKGEDAVLLQQQKDAGAMQREIEDNATALRIAESGAKGSANASAKAGARNPASRG